MKKLTHMLLALMILGTYSVFHTAHAVDECATQDNSGRTPTPPKADPNNSGPSTGTKTGTGN